jgi:cytochrome P450 family 142 subfamily A polypeptide 1
MHHEFGELDLLDASHHADPWPLYDWMREEAPAYKDANGHWYVTRYDDIVAVAKDPDTFTSIEGNRPTLPPDHSFIHLDGEAHKARRDLIKDWFSPRAMKQYEQHVRDVASELIDAVIERGTTEFVGDISKPLPARIMCEMTGVPPEMQEQVTEWLDVFTRAGQNAKFVDESVNDAFFGFGLMHMDLVEERRAEPKNDLLSLWVNASPGGGPMNEDQLLFEHTMLMVGGSETSRNALSGGLYMLTQHKDQRDWLRDHPEGLNNAIEEILRWTTPFMSMSRTLTKDVVMHGQQMKAGETIVMMYPPANRDPRHFDDPHRFDVRREFKKGQLAFGFGRHFCLGAPLARLEVKVVMEEVLKRMPDFDLAGEPVFQRTSFIRGLIELPLRFTPGATSGTTAAWGIV